MCGWSLPPHTDKGRIQVRSTKYRFLYTNNNYNAETYSFNRIKETNHIVTVSPTLCVLMYVI
jgi:hypothetical protein